MPKFVDRFYNQMWYMDIFGQISKGFFHVLITQNLEVVVKNKTQKYDFHQIVKNQLK